MAGWRAALAGGDAMFLFRFLRGFNKNKEWDMSWKSLCEISPLTLRFLLISFGRGNIPASFIGEDLFQRRKISKTCQEALSSAPTYIRRKTCNFRRLYQEELSKLSSLCLKYQVTELGHILDLSRSGDMITVVKGKISSADLKQCSFYNEMSKAGDKYKDWIRSESRIYPIFYLSCTNQDHAVWNKWQKFIAMVLYKNEPSMASNKGCIIQKRRPTNS